MPLSALFQKPYIKDRPSVFDRPRFPTDPREDLSFSEKFLTNPSISQAIDTMAAPFTSPVVAEEMSKNKARPTNILETEEQSKNFKIQLPQWYGVPLGEEQYKQRPPNVAEIPLSPPVSDLLQNYTKWTEETPSGKYWTGGAAQEDIETVGSLALMGSLGIGAIKNLVSSPMGQNIINRVAGSPTLQRMFGKNVSADKVFEIYTKVSRGTAGGELTKFERKVWDAIQAAGQVLQAQKHGFKLRPFDKGGAVEIPKELRLPSPSKVSSITNFYAGAPIKFKPGDAVKFGDAIYKISTLSGNTAQLLSATGEKVNASLAELTQYKPSDLFKPQGKKPLIEESLKVYLDPINSKQMQSFFGNEKIKKAVGNIDVTKGEFEGGRYLFKDSKGKYVGALNYTGNKKKGFIVSNIYTEPESRNKGIASKLLELVKKDMPNIKVSSSLTKMGEHFFRKVEKPLIEEAKKYKTAEEFVEKHHGKFLTELTEYDEENYDQVWLRVLPKGQKIKIGEELESSKIWEQTGWDLGHRTAEEAGNVSALEIPISSKDPILIDKVLKLLNNYEGEEVVLISGNRKGGGVDEWEVVIEDAIAEKIYPKSSIIPQQLTSIWQEAHKAPSVPPAKPPTKPQGKKPLIEEVKKSIKRRGVKGNDLLDAEDRIDEILANDKTAEIDNKGFITLYHRTTSKNAERIVKSGEMLKKETSLFFGTKSEGQISGYGEAVIKVKVPIEKTQIDDIFKDEVHLTIPGKDLKSVQIKAEIDEKPLVPSVPEPKTPTQIEVEKFTAGQVERVVKQADKQDISTIKQPPTPKSELESWEGKFELPKETMTEAIRRTIEDLNLRLKKVNEKIKEVSGKEVKEHLDIWSQKDMLPRKQSDQIRRVREDKRGFVEKLVKDNIDVDEIDKYLHAKHAVERNAMMNKKRAESNKGPLEGLSGMTDAEASEILAQAPKEFKKYDSVIRKMSNDLLGYEVENGLLKAEDAEKIRSAYEYYVPLFRDLGKESSIGIGQGIDIRGKEIKRAKGSTKRVISPIANLFHQQERARARVLKNDIGKAIIEMTEEYPETKDLFEVKAQKYLPRFNQEGELQFLDPQFKLGDDVIGAKIEGKQYFITIKDQKVAQALKNTNLARSGSLTRHMRAAIGLWSGMKTRWRPEFLISNFERDLGEALLNLGVEKERLGKSQKGLRRAIIKDLFPSQKQIWDYLSGKKKPEVDEFFKLGGDTGHFWAENINKAEKSLKQIEKEITGAGSERIVKHIRKVGEVIDNLNTMVELGVRYATYKQLVKRGFSKQRAVQSAADLTVNFSRQGEISPMLKAFYGFINPAIQGSSKVIRSIATPYGKKKYSRRVVKGIAALMAMGFLTRAISSLIDDEGDEQIPDWSKNNRITISIGNGKTVNFWNLPYGYSTFFAMGSNMYEVMAERKTYGEALGEVVTSAVESFSPFNTSLNSLVPTLVKPIYEVNQNKNWYEGPVYPSQVFTRTPSPDSETYFKNTRNSAIFATSILNKLSGGGDGKAGLIDVHPNTLQYLYSQYAGGPFEFLTSSVEAAARGVKGEFDPNKTPFVRQIYREGKPSQWSYGVIFDTLENAAKKDLSQLQKDRFYRAVDVGVEEEIFTQKTANGYVQDFIRAQNDITGRILDNGKILGSMPREDFNRLLDTYAPQTQKRMKNLLGDERKKKAKPGAIKRLFEEKKKTKEIKEIKDIFRKEEKK